MEKGMLFKTPSRGDIKAIWRLERMRDAGVGRSRDPSSALRQVNGYEYALSSGTLTRSLTRPLRRTTAYQSGMSQANGLEVQTVSLS